MYGGRQVRYTLCITGRGNFVVPVVDDTSGLRVQYKDEGATMYNNVCLKNAKTIGGMRNYFRLDHKPVLRSYHGMVGMGW